MSIKNFIDYTHQGDGVNSREALYAAIHDRVAEAINGKKIDIAQKLVGQNESVEELDELSKDTLKSYLKKSQGDERRNKYWLKSSDKMLDAALADKGSEEQKKAKASEKALLNKGSDIEKSRIGAKARLIGTTKKESVNEAREDSPIKGTVKKATYENGAHKVEVRYSPEWDDYQVHPYKNGKHMGEGPVSYHGGDKEDAHETAKSVLAHLSK